MANDIDEFYYNITSPFVREFESDRSSLRLAYGAAWALDSFASHIFYSLRETAGLTHKDDIKFKNNELRPNSKDFELIMDISATTKHAERWKTAKTSVGNSSELSSENLQGWAAYCAGPDADEWGEQVIVNNKSHLFKPLLPVVLRAEHFLICKKNHYKSGKTNSE